MPKILLLVISSLFLFSCEKKQDASLINKWKVEAYLRDNNSISQTVNVPLYVSFKNDKSMSISLDVNTCQGTYSFSDKKLSIQNIACTEMCCDSKYATELVDLLYQVNSFYCNGNQMNLMGENQMIIRFNLAD